MHSHSVGDFTHDHVFLGADHDRHARQTMAVVALTAVMMVAEIVGGTVFGSMALIADGWHMFTHAGALGIAALAYRFARRHARDPRFAFGTGKLGELAAFASALILGMIALLIAYESGWRLLHPVAIGFSEAIPIAVVGLCVNLASVWLLHDDHHHDDHDHHDGHDQATHGHKHHHDTNFRAAYVHVLADALTSVLAIFALCAGLFLGLTWLDPVMGFVGAGVIATWSATLLRTSGSVLVDAAPGDLVGEDIRRRLESDGDRITDLHLWQVGPGHRAAVIALVSDDPQAPSVYKRKLAGVPDISHMTIEVERCPGHPQAA